MKICTCLTISSRLFGMALSGRASADEISISGMGLLPGYKHHPLKGVNFSTKMSSEVEVAEALLMLLTYPDPVKEAPKP